MQFPTKLAAGSAGALVFGIVFGWVAFPGILKSQLKKQMSLAPGTEVRDMWTTFPFPLDFKIFLFNCTNAEDVMKGAKPRIKEVGPYFYEEWKEKLNMVDIEEEDAIYYNRRDTFLFKKEKSEGLTGEEMITMPHIVILSTAIKVAAEKPAMLSLVGKAINSIYEDPGTVFLTAKAKDVIFDGVLIDCTKTDFAAKAVCNAYKQEETLEAVGETHFKLSFFGMKNGTIEKPRFKVLRGTRDVMDVGKVVEFKGEKSQSVWSGPACNDYGGTDSTIFPPFLTEKDELLSFTPDICRSLGAHFSRKSAYAGIPANRYVAGLGSLREEPGNQCFCPGDASTCPAKGLMDLQMCLKAPLVVSLPHFMDTDPDVQNGVHGLRPDAEKHGIYIDFEPISGTPLQARKRLQFNIPLAHLEKLELFKNLTNTLMPIFWVEEGLALNATFISMLEKQLFIPLRVVGVVKWLLVSLGTLGFLTAGLLHQKKRLLALAVGHAPEPHARVNVEQRQQRY